MIRRITAGVLAALTLGLAACSDRLPDDHFGDLTIAEIDAAIADFDLGGWGVVSGEGRTFTVMGPELFTSRDGVLPEGQGSPTYDLHLIDGLLAATASSDDHTIGETRQGLPYVYWSQEVYICTNHCEYPNIHVGVIHVGEAVTGGGVYHVAVTRDVEEMSEEEFLWLFEDVEVTR